MCYLLPFFFFTIMITSKTNPIANTAADINPMVDQILEAFDDASVFEADGVLVELDLSCC